MSACLWQRLSTAAILPRPRPSTRSNLNSQCMFIIALTEQEEHIHLELPWGEKNKVRAMMGGIPSCGDQHMKRSPVIKHSSNRSTTRGVGAGGWEGNRRTEGESPKEQDGGARNTPPGVPQQLPSPILSSSPNAAGTHHPPSLSRRGRGAGDLPQREGSGGNDTETTTGG